MTTRSANTVWPRLLAGLLGLGYLALGVLGFLLADGSVLERAPGNTVWVFGASAVLNIVHLAVGVLGLAAATKVTGAQFYGWALLAGFAGLTAYGVLVAATASGHDILNLNWEVNMLHGVTAVLGFLLGYLPSALATRQPRR
ncbi:DUF4383 domain-containing protein [Amycolatopsis cihanbeyliensis]|uniref:Uncharacterized protein DUF4383 n=1 Tax=Amycolatopsis cihanbeyliensis TaxID=1128664 RepID=A0A542DFM8_AMYCI|nr:DUF4383 domain-containing protein [Amycolatopsis cihanbeyliensis]TQJ01866.1 uncharacterized protein DUF4383 [Amycolatopsis cihanbeyliensis]